MLLTSSQVSVLITTTIVVLCTAALFFAGFTIQQRTLRDLRTAIRPVVVPRPKPKTYAFPPDLLPQDGGEPAVRVQIHDESSRGSHSDDDTIIIRPSVSDQQKPLERETKGADGGDDNDPSALQVERSKHWDGVQEGGKPLTSAERRRRIKAEIERLSRGDETVYYQRRLW